MESKFHPNANLWNKDWQPHKTAEFIYSDHHDEHEDFQILLPNDGIRNACLLLIKYYELSKNYTEAKLTGPGK